MNGELIGIVGLGLLGRGIAACFLAHGYRVVAVDSSEAQRELAHSHIDASLRELVERTGLDPGIVATWTTRFLIAADFTALHDCTFVVESVTESLKVKAAVLESIESVVASAEAVVATNTSAIPISLLQERCRQPERIVGMHWAEPAQATRFMELIRGAQTSDAAFQAAESMARRLGKEPSLVLKDTPGFIVNRVAYAMYREALELLQEGVADAETIDSALRHAIGLWAGFCGPLRWMDLTGGPELYARAMAPVLPALSRGDTLSPLIASLAEGGARGIANSHGFFTYTPESAQRWEDRYRDHIWNSLSTS